MAWTLAAVGDIMLQHPVGDNAALRGLRDADLVFANLEVPLSTRGYPADKPITFRSDPALAAELTRLELDVVSLANNHALDFGIPALLDTIAAVEEAGVAAIGAGETLDAALQPRRFQAADATVAFLAFASTLPTGTAATAYRPGLAPLGVEVHLVADAPVFEEQPGTSPYVHTRVRDEDLERACQALAMARAQADVVIASIHWGVPPGWAAAFQGVLADYQQPLAHALVEAGADLVLGHHPHTLHGIESYRGKLICYSLGNFIFHSLVDGKLPALQRSSPPYNLNYLHPPEIAESAIFLFTRTARRWDLDLVPCVLDAHGECTPAAGAQAETILRRVARLSADLGTEIRIEGSRGHLAYSE